ncbi:MAG: 1,4-dihydroxy-2-naphthoate polyprenyltransferase [Actinobacteria bacterium]|nr:1,4-dihydroxy-2-naphthoate polyprenyltransferase [Actinomycetota bacterium]
MRACADRRHAPGNRREFGQAKPAQEAVSQERRDPSAPRLNVWVEGARPRTLGAAAAPVAVGTALAGADGHVVAWRAAAALVVALALQVGTNYANDYSDGVRGTDAERQGPRRLTASGLVAPTAVLRAAMVAFGVAAVAGLALAVAVDLRLLVVGAAALAAGVLYTGGPRPYGYAGLGEAAVLVFFGLVATAGSAYVHLERVPAAALPAAAAVGLPACALLLTNNLRDATTDAQAGKRTLVVRVGVATGRRLYVACLVGALVAVSALAWARPSTSMALLALPLAVAPVRVVRSSPDPPALVGALLGTARLQIVLAALLSVGLWAS